jgi:hypothetical protein
MRYYISEVDDSVTYAGDGPAKQGFIEVSEADFSMNLESKMREHGADEETVSSWKTRIKPKKASRSRAKEGSPMTPEQVQEWLDRVAEQVQVKDKE